MDMVVMGYVLIIASPLLGAIGAIAGLFVTNRVVVPASLTLGTLGAVVGLFMI